MVHTSCPVEEIKTDLQDSSRISKNFYKVSCNLDV